MRIVDRLAHDNRWSARHPGDKLILGGGLLVLAMALPAFPGAVFVLIAAIALALAGARLPAGDYLRVLLPPLGFLAASALPLAVSVDAREGLPVLLLSDEGLATAAGAGGRALAATAALLLVVLTTPVVELLALLRRTRLPAPIIEIMLLVYRFVGISAATVAAARAARAQRLGDASLGRAIRSAGLLIAALLPRILARASRLHLGLAARGYDGELRVLAPARPPSPSFVAAALALDAVLVAATAAWRWALS